MSSNDSLFIKEFDLLSIIKDLNTDWKKLILDNVEIIEEINLLLNNEHQKFSGLQKIFPPQNEIFNAFNYFNISDTRVVIIGQDVYHQINQANGLCFSVNKGIKIPPSLKNIFKELKEDIGFNIPDNGDLTNWAKQGILLLNSSLTVRESAAGSHMNIWEPLTDDIISQISKLTEKTIFILWGNFAKKKKKLIDINKHYILEANHPSPLSANRPGWFGNKHFSKCNEILKSNNKEIIDWNL